MSMTFDPEVALMKEFKNLAGIVFTSIIIIIYFNIDTGKYHESDSKYLHECRRHECKYSYQTSDI